MKRSYLTFSRGKLRKFHLKTWPSHFSELCSWMQYPVLNKPDNADIFIHCFSCQMLSRSSVSHWMSNTEYAYEICWSLYYINIELSMLRPNMILYFHPSTLKHYNFPHKASFPKLFVPVSSVNVRMQHALLGFCWNSALKFCCYLGPRLVFWDTAVKLGSTWKTLWYWTVGGTGTVSLKGFCWVAPKEAPSWDFRRWWKPQVYK